jgi:L-rhamnose mutarotase
MSIRITVPRAAIALFMLGTIFVAAGSVKTDKVQRYGAVIGVKPDKLAYYKQLHANPWPTVDQALKESNIRNYSIYLTQFDDGNWYLFSYFEHTGSDFEADMEKLGENSHVQRWWKETDPCQVGLQNRKEGEWWKSMPEVYHLD